MEFILCIYYFHIIFNCCNKHAVHNAIYDNLPFKTVFLLYVTFREPSANIVLPYQLLKNLNKPKYYTINIKIR